ncbi:DUF1003 domain-containing protein [Candidatus Kaiserbacteria bacterium]|nr:DUF1003 domain-containing protein [Candidatus Kaiserbacteria bacterium]
MRRTWTDSLAEFLTLRFGTVPFLLANVAVFALWILINLGDIPGIGIFDPYPFNLLTMVVSLEAIVLSVIVLMAQNRQSKMEDIRDQIDTEIDVRAEEEITMLLVMLEKVAQHLQVPMEANPELERMKQGTDLKRIRTEIERHRG